MVIANCEGCECEFNEASYWVREGYHIATMVGREFIGKGHLAIIIVDDNGRVVLE